MAEKRASVGKKKLKVSKNRKKTWRKTDISDVNEYLDEKRLQERTGGIVAEKADASLFFVDKKSKQHEQDEVVKRSKKEPKKLKCYQILEPDPFTIPAKVKNDVKTRFQRKLPDAMKNIQNARTLRRIQESRVDKKKHRVGKLNSRKTKNDLPITSYDLWADGNPNTDFPVGDSHYLRVTRKAPIKVPHSVTTKRSGLESVPLPHPGASYNPAYDDHQEILTLAHEVEVKKDKEERRLYNALEGQFKKSDIKSVEGQWIKEMGPGIMENDSSDDEINNDCRISINPPVRADNVKLKAVRNKERKMKEDEKSVKKEKMKKKIEQDILRIKSIKAEIKQKEVTEKDRKRRKEKLAEVYKDKPKKLGKYKYEEPDIEVKLSDELTGSLRSLKPEGHILSDRFKNLQKRNLLESKRKVQSNMFKKYKKKSFVKKSYQEYNRNANIKS